MSDDTAGAVRTVILDDDSLDFEEVVSPSSAPASSVGRTSVTTRPPKSGGGTDSFLSFCNLVQQYAVRLRTIATSGGKAETQAEELRGLLRTADQIFQLEQRLMRVTGFRGQAAHLADHKALRTALETLIDRLSKPGEMADWRLPEILERWVARHQRRYDGPLESHLKVIALIRGPGKSKSDDQKTDAKKQPAGSL